MFKKTIKLWTVAFFFIWESFLFNIKLFTENVPCVDFSSEKDVKHVVMQFLGNLPLTLTHCRIEHGHNIVCCYYKK